MTLIKCIVIKYVRFNLIYLFIYFCFLGPHPGPVEFPRLGVELSYSCRPQPQPQQRRIRAMSLPYTTAHGSAHGPLSETKDRTHNLMVTSRICFHCSTRGAPIRLNFFFYNDFYFFHYSLFTVFCQLFTVQQGDPVTYTRIHFFLTLSCSIVSD